MLSLVDPAPFAPCPAPFNMAAHVLRHAGDCADKVALSVISAQGARDLTYGGLEAAVRGTATGLLAQGLLPGDRVLMRLGNDVDFPIAYLGALAAGLVPVPTAAGLTAREVAAMIETIGPKAILRDPQIACPDHDAILPLDALQRMRDLPPAEWHMGDPERPGYIIFTSGTSGRATPVLHAHRAIWARQMMFDGWYGLGAEDRLLHAGAFNWTYTLGTGLMDPWTAGATALIPEAGTAPAALPDLVRQHGATIFAAAPGVYRQMLKHHDKVDLPDLRHGLSAGEKMAPELAARWERATGRAVHEAFGMSECSTFISASPSRPAPATALGRPQPGRRVAVLGEAGPQPCGTPGVIGIHRDDPGLMLGYLDAPDLTEAKFQGDWFLTGDVAVMDETGLVTYQGRRDDMMNAGGFRVSPLEVEAVLAGMPGITGVGVVEVPVKPEVTVIAAFYTGPEPLDETALADYAKARLARYKCPRIYVHLPRLPMGANGKLQRRALRDAYEAPVHD